MLLSLALSLIYIHIDIYMSWFHSVTSSQFQKLPFTPITLCCYGLCVHVFLHYSVYNTLVQGVSIAQKFGLVSAVLLFLLWGWLSQV